ncbi:MAG: hypothetical protein KDA37_08895, partial [Planctomycetales bacterium]|nr:hypothetical protein [Planctomycetales bacterium]
ALLAGLLLTIAAPAVLYGLARATADPDLPPAQVDQVVRDWGQHFAWIMPVGKGLAFFGGIGLLFIWVSSLAEQRD